MQNTKSTQKTESNSTNKDLRFRQWEQKRQNGDKKGIKNLRKTHSSRSMELRLLLRRVDVSNADENKKFHPRQIIEN